MNASSLRKTDAEWRAKLTQEEFRVIREKGTERPFSGRYDKFYPDKGYFACKACDSPIYSSVAKFNSGCGWPAFDMCYKGAVVTLRDTSHGMHRVEIMCAKCGGHLGHVFGERQKRSNERHCVNSVSLRYVDEDLTTELIEEALIEEELIEEALLR